MANVSGHTNQSWEQHLVQRTIICAHVKYTIRRTAVLEPTVCAVQPTSSAAVQITQTPAFREPNNVTCSLTYVQILPPAPVFRLDLSTLFFSVQGTGGSPTGPDPENRVGNQDNGSPGRPISSRLQVPGEPGHCRARTRPP